MRRRTLLAALALPWGAEPAAAAVRQLPKAHAHNDYEHDRPLLDALEQGFTSIEADIYLVRDQLLIGHEPWDLRPSRTLQSLYLDPLRRRASSLPTKPLNLVVDVKTSAEPAWARLNTVLSGYGDLLTRWTRRNGTWTVRNGAVTVVVTGQRALTTMAALDQRSAAVEGRAVDAAGRHTASFMPEIAADWALTYRWRGNGAMPAGERAAMRGLVARCHTAGRKLRFWNTPDSPGPARTAVWTELLAAGVDRINSDDLEGLARFLRSR